MLGWNNDRTAGAVTGDDMPGITEAIKEAVNRTRY
jgi:hypothetical protein